MIIKITPMLSSLSAAQCAFKVGSVPIDTNCGGRNPEELARDILITWECVRPVKHQAIHIMLAPRKAETLTDEQWCEAIRMTLDGLGYGDAPFFARLDTEQGQAHVVTSPITYEGTRVDRGGDHFKAKHIARQIEVDFGLSSVPNFKHSGVRVSPTLSDQKTNLRDTVYAQVLSMIPVVKTVGQLAEKLRGAGIHLDASFSKGTGRVVGLGFRLEGPRGGYLKASEVHSSFSLSKLQTVHGLEYHPDRDNPCLHHTTNKPAMRGLR